MLVRRADAAIDDDEWRAWLADGHDFGQLVVNTAQRWPVAVPTHFLFDGGHQVVLHLALINPVWPAIERCGAALLSVTDDYAFIPGTWRPPEGKPPDQGVPTSYYSAVQLACSAAIVDDPESKAEILRRQLAHFQPEGGHGELHVGQPPYGQLLGSIRGLRLTVERVTGKFKYDDSRPASLRRQVAQRLAERGGGRDMRARAQQLRRLERTEGGVPD